MLLNKIRTPGESKVSSVNQGIREGGESKIFLCYPRVSGTSH